MTPKPKKYLKHSPPVEAMQYMGTTKERQAVAEWCGGNEEPTGLWLDGHFTSGDNLVLLFDWVVKYGDVGVRPMFKKFSNESFQKWFEEVPDDYERETT